MKYLNTRDELIASLPKKLKVAELGVFDGSFSRNIINLCQPEQFFMVDVFEGVTCSGDKDGNDIKYLNLGEQFTRLSNLYLAHPNVKVIKATSENFLESIPDEFLDAVYIDADHSYLGVKKDLELSLRKVKKGGYIMGHDYNHSTFPEVVQAVDEFCMRNNFTISYLTRDGCPTFLIFNN